jgi:CubicO group peptidase (beta-lactamase class C family)
MPGGVLAIRGGTAESGWALRAFGNLGVTRQIAPVTGDAVYDLASVTKILSTTALVMAASDRGLTGGLDAPLASFGWTGPSDTVSLTIRNLLSHRSGLPAWRPLYLLGGTTREERSGLAREAILRERPLFPQGSGTLYSDLGFMLLGFLAEELLGGPLDELFRREVAGPLGLGGSGFGPLAAGGFARGETDSGAAGDGPPGKGGGLPVAPTEDGFRCGGPTGWPGVPILGPVPPGRVHDDNAAWLGGAAGHAGLFARAADVMRVVDSWLESFRGSGGTVSRRTVTEFLSLQGPENEEGRRGLGFDATAAPSGRGVLFGHKGYTGTAVWFDPAGCGALVLLCNRVHPTARRGGMDAVRAALLELAFGA